MTIRSTTAVEITRIIAAPPERVYRAWLDPQLVRRWFAPSDYTVAGATVDEWVGGRHSVRQVDADGNDVGGAESEIVQLVPNRKIVLRWSFVGPDRAPDPAQESLLTIRFAATDDGGTELTLTHERLDGLRAAAPEIADGVSAGWAQALDALVAAVGS